MKVFSTSTGVQTLKIIPREEVTDVEILITDTFNNYSSTSILSTAVNSNGYMTIEFSYDGFKEGNTYTLEVNKQVFVDENKKCIYKDLIYCTNQTDIQNFKQVPEARDNIVII